MLVGRVANTRQAADGILQMHFSTKAFLNHQFGSPDGVLMLLGRHGVPVPNREAVVKWFYRGNIPGDWWPILILALQAEGTMPADFGNYIEGNKDDVFA